MASKATLNFCEFALLGLVVVEVLYGFCRWLYGAVGSCMRIIDACMAFVGVVEILKGL